MKSKSITTSGKRKSAIARASLKAGSGLVSVNGIALESYEPVVARLRIKEPLILAGAAASKVDIILTVSGGGVTSQADAARLAVARVLVEKDEKLKATFIDYDRQLLVADIRRKEAAKPNSHGNARAKRQKSYR